jgi:uncharacterized membrane protein YeaQ/YmgE (transglycosylase-associated protein family)
MEASSVVINFLAWVVLGLIAGVVAKLLGKEREKLDPAGLIGTGLLGIAGAVVWGISAASCLAETSTHSVSLASWSRSLERFCFCSCITS